MRVSARVCVGVCHILVSDDRARGKENNRTIVAHRAVWASRGARLLLITSNNSAGGKHQDQDQDFVLTQLYLRSDRAAARDGVRMKAAEPRHPKQPCVLTAEGFSY